MWIGALCYAGGLILISPTLKGIHRLLGICENFGNEFDVKCISSKTTGITFGKQRDVTQYSILLNGDQLLWTDTMKFLGIHLTNDMDDKLDIFNKRGDFYGRVNSLLASFGGLLCNILNDLFCSYYCSFYGSRS